MAAYDIFLKNPHSDSVAKIMQKNNYKLINYLCSMFEPKQLDILEIGPGKGYFKDAVQKYTDEGYTLNYYAVDRNKNILLNLGINKNNFFVAEMPHIKCDKKFDIIFIGYVIEHLSSGLELFEALSNVKSLLNDNGILVLQFPDSMKLGMEFYNIDYTHSFPTTKRNVNQALLDNSMYVKKAINLRGILYTKKVDRRIRYFFKSFIMSFYSYRIMNIVSKIFYHVPLWDLGNIFWRTYGLLKEPNVMFIAKQKSI